MWNGEGKSPTLIVKEKELELIRDQNELERICQAVMDSHQKQVILITSGKLGTRGVDA